MIRQQSLPGILLVLVLTACSRTLPSTSTPILTQPTNVPTLVTVQRTPTNTPINLPTQPSTPSPGTKSNPAVIEPNNAGQMVELAKLGKGTILSNPAYSPDGMPIHSPNGKWLAVPTSAGIYLYETNTMEALFNIPAGTPFIAFSPDSRILAASERGAISLWNPATGEQVSQLQGDPEDFYWELTFSSNGSFLAAISWDSEISIWALESGERQFLLPGDRLRFSPDGKMAVTTVYGEDEIHLYETQNGTEINQWNVQNAGFAPDGQLWLEDDKSVRLITVDLNQATAPFEGVQPSFSADGTLMALFTNGQISLYDHKKGRRVQILEGSYIYIDGVLFSPNGQTLAGEVYTLLCPTCTEMDGLNRSLVLWRAADGTIVSNTKHPSGWVGYSTDGSSLTAAGMESIQIVRTDDGSIADHIDGFTAPVAGMALSPDGKTLAAVYATDPYILRFWDLKSDQVVGTLHGQNNASAENNMAVAYSPEADYLAVRGDLWDLARGEQMTSMEQAISAETSCWSSSVDFAPQAKILATGCFEGQLNLWSLPDGTLQKRITSYNSWVDDLAFSPDGIHLAAVYGVPDYLVQIWMLPGGNPVFSLTGGRFTRVAYAQNMNMLATVATNSDYDQYGWAAGYVQLWNSSNGAAILQLDMNDAVSIAFSPDSQILATGSLEGTLRLWETSSGKLLLQARRQLGTIQRLAFTPDGTSLMSGSQDGTILQWGLPPVSR